ncbi:MAG: lipoprotein signal peptidase [Bacteroidetes bacterium]|nr:lipoprotein signal peptidase [Bacteroidota bacterium]
MQLVKKPLILIFSILLIDQLIKIYVKTHFFLGEEIHVAGNWFILHFTENNGMAYGMEFGGDFGKLFLSVFRMIAIAGIGWYMWTLTKKNEDKFFIICIALIFAGAVGNLIDSAFYGMIFSDSGYEVARFMPEEGGYSSFLHGKVVDMFYFPVIEGHFPSWFPLWGGEEFIFFRPVFNFADAAISLGVILIILNQKRFFAKKEELTETSLAADANKETVVTDTPNP